MATKKSQSHSGGAPSKRASKTKSAESQAGHSGHPLTDHKEIQKWAEARNAVPSCVKGTGDKDDVGMIRLNFPGYSGEDSLQEISWKEWFAEFDQKDLALLVQDTTAGGEKSNFNKLVSRANAEKQPRGRHAK